MTHRGGHFKEFDLKKTKGLPSLDILSSTEKAPDPHLYYINQVVENAISKDLSHFKSNNECNHKQS